VSRWIDGVCGYRLPWRYNVLALYLRDAAEAAGEDWPPACDYYSAFAKYGVHQLVACWLLTFGAPSRKVAVRAADVIDERMDDPEDLVKWLQRGGMEALEERGVSLPHRNCWTAWWSRLMPRTALSDSASGSPRSDPSRFRWPEPNGRPPG
jgi:hypothetical protein